jgi:carboxyl-terminal processing protease
VGRYFLYRERLGAWDLWKHHYDGRLTSEEATQAAIHDMVSSLRDDYTYYRDTDATTERRQEEDAHDVVASKMLPGNIGYLHLSMFNSKDCVDEATEALQQLSTARSYIIDLRGNKGGAINNAYHFFALLMPKGQFVHMDGLPDGKREIEDLSLNANCAVTKKCGTIASSYREPNLTGSKPMIVLVDGTTKSAAEMVAGSLRDNDRALLVGTRTFGKGVIQRVWEFDDGTSIKITAARYFLPSGENPHGVGLKPNILVANKRAHDDSQLQAAILLLSNPARMAATAKKHGGIRSRFS